MKNLKRTILIILCLLSIQTFGQGVPKAYEGINYQGKVNSWPIRLMLANGYIGASYIKLYAPGQKKPLVFEPAAGVADEHNRLKFITEKQNDPAYFILANMQDAYEEIPNTITGTSFVNGKKMPVTFRLIRHDKRQRACYFSGKRELKKKNDTFC